MASYLEEYANRFNLPIRLETPVRSLTKDSDTFRLDLGSAGSLKAKGVIVATGAFGVPATPSFARELDPEVITQHSYDYRRPSDMPHGIVLVVGAGNTGHQLALVLASARRTVYLAHGAKGRSLPQRIARRDIFWWLARTKLITAPMESSGRPATATTIIGFRFPEH